ncbi:MAG: nickel pincer cofactor biosynthesis protein LarB [Actinobacteria bacterium]|nr:nickel pincer cofactor biosynthesis protein LarB [Actinomycetota bacterium]
MSYEETLKDLLGKVESGELSTSAAFNEIKSLPFSDLGFAKVDHHRELRQGFAEVVFCQGKTPNHISSITRVLLEENKGNILLTRATEEVFNSIYEIDNRAEFNSRAGTITIVRDTVPPYGLVAVISAGTADMPVAEEARTTAIAMGSRVEHVYDAGVAGAHRLFQHRELIERSSAIVVVAGMEGALASLVGGIAPCPVIAVPTSIGYGASFGGLAALLAMLNSCAAGVSVVNIDNGFGGGYLAGMINRMLHGKDARV